MGRRPDGPHDRPPHRGGGVRGRGCRDGGDDAKLVDELGDLLYQTFFLSLLLSERGAGDLETVARGVHDKLVRRHPHVFEDAGARLTGGGEAPLGGAEDRAGGREGVFHDVPEPLPALLYARKVQRRAARPALPSRSRLAPRGLDESSTSFARSSARGSRLRRRSRTRGSRRARATCCSASSPSRPR